MKRIKEEGKKDDKSDLDKRGLPRTVKRMEKTKLGLDRQK
jgi:hypothetical protein